MCVFVFCLFCVWAVSSHERRGVVSVCILFCFGNFLSVCGVSVTDETWRQNAYHEHYTALDLICTVHWGYCYKRIPVPLVLCHSLTELTDVPGKGMGFLQNFQNFLIRVRKCYRTNRSSGYCCTGVHNSQKFRAGKKVRYPYPGHLWHGRTELTEVSGTGINAVQNLQKFRVRVWMSGITYRSSLSWVNTPGMVLYVPYTLQNTTL